MRWSISSPTTIITSRKPMCRLLTLILPRTLRSTMKLTSCVLSATAAHVGAQRRHHRLLCVLYLWIWVVRSGLSGHDDFPASWHGAKDRDEVIRELIDIQYTRNEMDFHRSTFRVRGDTLEIFPANSSDTAVRSGVFRR